MNPGDKVYLLRVREIHAAIYHGAPAAAFQREKWCSVALTADGRLRDVERTDVFVTDAAARAELQNRNAALIAEAEAVVAALAAFAPFAVVVVDRTGTK